MVALATRKEENMANKNDIRIDLKKIHPLLRLYLERIIKYANAEGIYIIITEGFRSKERQDELYAQGRTKPGIVCTNARGSDYNSQHQWGVAIDFCIANDGKTWNYTMMKRVAEIGKEHCKHLGWGGDWTVKVDGLIDNPHLYLDKWGKNPSPLKKTYGLPENFLKTFTGAVTGTKKGLSIFNKTGKIKRKRIVQKQPNGTVFNILRRGKIWCRVEYNGKYGYALSKYLK